MRSQSYLHVSPDKSAHTFALLSVQFLFPLSLSLTASKASSRRHRRHHDGRHRSHRHRHYKPHVPGGASASEFTASELDTATEVTTDADTTSYCDTEDTLR